MKAYTSIPYAKETAALMSKDEVFGLKFDPSDFWFWIRVMHFELRYNSIDQLLVQTPYANVLELSSGFSWRGIALCEEREDVHYLDTDLAEIITLKTELRKKLGLGNDLKGKWEPAVLNALEKDSFQQVMSRMDSDPLAIINEGLLMYLNTEEKKTLCRNIRHVLSDRGGCWITADVYVKRSEDMRAALPQGEREAAFFEQHNIEANKFDSYEAAKIFFEDQGFSVSAEAQPEYDKISVLPQLMEVMPDHVKNSKEPPPKIQATWRLEAR